MEAQEGTDGLRQTVPFVFYPLFFILLTLFSITCIVGTMLWFLWSLSNDTRGNVGGFFADLFLEGYIYVGHPRFHGRDCYAWWCFVAGCHGRLGGGAVVQKTDQRVRPAAGPLQPRV